VDASIAKTKTHVTIRHRRMILGDTTPDVYPTTCAQFAVLATTAHNCLGKRCIHVNTHPELFWCDWQGTESTVVMAALGALPGASASSGAAAELRSIFYSEFDNLKGPQLAFQAPDGYVGRLSHACDSTSGVKTQGSVPLGGFISRAVVVCASFLSDDVFDGVSDYIITKPQLCGKMVSITTGQHLIMGYPLRVESERYHRSTLMFNVGMVFPAGTDTTRFEGVLRKLGNSFHTLETESSLLQDPEKKVLYMALGFFRGVCMSAQPDT